MIRAGSIFNPNIIWHHKVEENYFMMMGIVDIIKTFLNKCQPVDGKKKPRFLVSFFLTLFADDFTELPFGLRGVHVVVVDPAFAAHVVRRIQVPADFDTIRVFIPRRWLGALVYSFR